MKLADLPVTFLLCRDIRHQWDEHTITVVKEGYTITRTIECRRCGTHKTELIDTWGDTFDILSRRYSYPDGYILRTPAKLHEIRKRSLRLMLKQNKEVR